MKKIISLVSSLVLVFSMMTIAKAANVPEAFVAVKNQTDSEITLTLGVNANGTGVEYFKSVYFQVEIPESILSVVQDVYANRTTSKEMFIASNPTNKAFKFNPNIWSYKYEAFGAVNGDMNYKEGKLILSQAIADGAMLTEDGVLAEVTLPLKAAIAEDVELTIANASINTTDFETDVKYGYGDPAVIGTCAGELTVTSATLKGEEKPEPEVTVAALEDGGDMYGMKTKVSKVTIPENVEVSKAVVTLDGVSKEYDLPAGVKGALAGFIAIIRYNAELVNPAFTLTIE